MKKYRTCFTLFLLWVMNGCDDNNETLTEYEKSVQYYVEENGTVVESDESNESFCKYNHTYDYDDGAQTYTFKCELYKFYKGTCDEIENEEALSDFILGSPPEKSMTVRNALHSQVLQVLEKLDNTGYTHHSKEEGPFVLQPSYTELLKKNDDNHMVPNHSIDSYNL